MANLIYLGKTDGNVFSEVYHPDFRISQTTQDTLKDLILRISKPRLNKNLTQVHARAGA
jgi:hypothetical protein